MDEEINQLLIENTTEFTPTTITAEDEISAIAESQIYLAHPDPKDLNKLSPLSIYYLIRFLNTDDKIKFLKENFPLIKENEDQIFLYNMESPRALAYYLPFPVLEEIGKLDPTIYQKLLHHNPEFFVHGFNQEDYIQFYTNHYDACNQMENFDFIERLRYYQKEQRDQEQYTKFLQFLLETYQDKIESFRLEEKIEFLDYFNDFETYQTLINSKSGNEFFSYTLFQNITSNQELLRIFQQLEPNILLDLYSHQPSFFQTLTLVDWIKLDHNLDNFKPEFQFILDSFPIEEVEESFKVYLVSPSSSSKLEPKKSNLEPLRYIETKYRNNIHCNGTFEAINHKTSIFSNTYLKNLKELKHQFQKKTITKDNPIYQKHLFSLIFFLKDQKIISLFQQDYFDEIDKLFFRIMMGESLTILFHFSSCEEITLFNRLRSLEFPVSDFSIEQLKKYQVKQHKQLYQKCMQPEELAQYKRLTLKLMLLVGFEKAKYILEYDRSLSTLKSLVEKVNVKTIRFDEKENPIVNKKILRILFNHPKQPRMLKILRQNDLKLYQYFSRMFNEWENIQLYKKDQSFADIIQFLKTDDLTLTPNYYRLQGQIQWIGSQPEIIKEACLLHDQVLKRDRSTIPKVKGSYHDYSYEVLNLQDMTAISLGNKTEDCFKISGKGYPCLKHGMTSPNGRILVIKKENQLLSHSWIWRNGNLLCFDSIETLKSLPKIDFLDVYLEVANQMIQISLKEEGSKTSIHNITIGQTSLGKPIQGISSFPCLISGEYQFYQKETLNLILKNQTKIVRSQLPQPIEDVNYSDSKNIQYLIKGNGDFDLFQSSYSYQDERSKPLSFYPTLSYSQEELTIIRNRLNAFKYQDYLEKKTNQPFSYTDIYHYQEIHCNDDWCLAIHASGKEERYQTSSNETILTEMNGFSNKTLIKSLSTIK